MATIRTNFRDVSRPSAVDEREAYEPHRSRSKRQSRRRQRTKHHDSVQPTRVVPMHHKMDLDLLSESDNAPTLGLDFISQPDEKIAFGKSVRVDVVVSLRHPRQHPSVQPMHLNYSRLITFTTLVSDGHNGERVPMEASALSTQKTCDTLHSIQEPEHQQSWWDYFPDRVPLGYSSFPELRIARPGTYRIRVTLMRAGGSAEEGATNVTSIDSAPISVYPPSTRQR
jgi:hypothetical protein